MFLVTQKKYHGWEGCGHDVWRQIDTSQGHKSKWQASNIEAETKISDVFPCVALEDLDMSV